MAKEKDVTETAFSVGLVDADLLRGGTRHPNLVLLKLAGFLHDNNIRFRLITSENEDVSGYDHIFISRVFTFNDLPSFYDPEDPRFHVGGTGEYAIIRSVREFKSKRTHDMQQLERDAFLNLFPNRRGGRKRRGIDLRRQMPFYDLYEDYIKLKVSEGRKESYYNDYRYYSIGFLTRGCVRHCPFCVNKLENSVTPYSDLDWFLDNTREKGRLKRPYIYLWDDNFLAAPREVWEPALKKLIESGRPFQFRQGLDERMIAESPDGEYMARLLAGSKYHGDFIFAFDNWRDRDLIERALKIWKRHCSKRGTKFYLFCGYLANAGGDVSKYDDEALFNDITLLFARIRILMRYDCFGYVMRHADYKNFELNNIYVQIARWCNQPQFYRYMSFWDYCYRNQSYWEQKTLKLDVDNLISFQEFEERYNAGYYNGPAVKLCKTMRTLLEFIERFRDRREEIIGMFSLKLKDLRDPTLWSGNQ